MPAQASVARRARTTRPREQSQTFFLFKGARSIVVPRLLLVLAVLTLTVIGLVMVYSASTVEALSEGSDPASYMVKQAVICAGSIVLCLAIALGIPYYKWLGRYLDVFWVLSMLLLLVTAVIGVAALGAQRWLTIGPVTFQPSEIAKVAFVLTAARIWYLYGTGEYTFGWLVSRAILFVFVPLAFLYATQSDLGTTLICLVGIIAVLWLGGFPGRVMVIMVAAVAVLGVAAIATTGYRSSRMAFLDPWADPYGSGYQLIHSFYAFGQGGLLGVGLGNSTEKYLYLPEAETDFIFAIIGEELGLVGALVVVALFLVVLYGGLQVARKAPDSFGAMIAGGCTIMLVFQAFLNIGCVIGLLPTTGKPLPFISSGGSSLLGSYLLTGVILSVSLASGDDSGVFEARRDALRVIRQERPARQASGPARDGLQARSGSRQDARAKGFRVIRANERGGNGRMSSRTGGRLPAGTASGDRGGSRSRASQRSASGRGDAARNRTGRPTVASRSGSGRGQRSERTARSGGTGRRSTRAEGSRQAQRTRSTTRSRNMGTGGPRRRGGGRR